jgi:hypothetical protein
MQEEEKYKKLRSTLKSLPRVKASKDFEVKLFKRIRDIESERLSGTASRKLEKYKSKGWIFNIFRPAFAPAIALTAVLFIVVLLYVYYASVYKEQVETLETEKMMSPEGREFTISKPKEQVIAKLEDKEETMERRPGTVTFESQPAPTDFSVPPAPVEADRKTETKAGPVMEEKLEEAPEKLELEAPKDEKRSDDIKKVEKKEAPALKKTDKEKEEGELNEQNVLGKEIDKSVIEGKRGFLDSSKVDSLKDKAREKEADKPGKIDTTKAPADEKEIKQQDSIEK